MKLKLGIITVIVVVGIGLYFYLSRDPVKVVVYTVLEGSIPKEVDAQLTEFIDWYKPMVSDAAPEVVAIMKRFDAEYRSKGAYRSKELEEFYPADEWIQRLLAKGIKINNYDDYSDYLEDRWYLYRAANNPDAMKDLKERHGLGDNASFDDLVDAEINENALFKQLVDQAMKDDPRVYGGEIDADGVFIPYRTQTVYVQEGEITSGNGVPKWVAHELSGRASGLEPSRQIPDDIDIIFLDATGTPLQDEALELQAVRYHLTSYLTDDIDTEIESVAADEPITTDFDTLFETDESDQRKNSEPDADFSVDELLDSTESNLDLRFTPQLPSDKTINPEVEQRLDEVERVLDEPESKDELDRRIEAGADSAKDNEGKRPAAPVDAEQETP